MTNTIFRGIIGTSPESKVIEYFCEWDGLDIHITDIASQAKIGRLQAYRVVKNLLDQGIIVKTRKVSTMQYYSFDKKHTVSRKFVQLFRAIIKNHKFKDDEI